MKKSTDTGIFQGFFVTQRTLKQFENKCISDAAIGKVVLKERTKRNKGKNLKNHHFDIFL